MTPNRCIEYYASSDLWVPISGSSGRKVLTRMASVGSAARRTSLDVDILLLDNIIEFYKSDSGKSIRRTPLQFPSEPDLKRWQVHSQLQTGSSALRILP